MSSEVIARQTVCDRCETPSIRDYQRVQCMALLLEMPSHRLIFNLINKHL